MPVHDDEQKRRHLAKECCYGAGLGVERGIEEGRKVQTHLKADNFSGEFNRRKDKSYSKTDGQANADLLGQRPQGIWTRNADHRLTRQTWLSGNGNQQCQPDPCP